MDGSKPKSIQEVEGETSRHKGEREPVPCRTERQEEGEAVLEPGRQIDCCLRHFKEQFEEGQRDRTSLLIP